MNPGLNAKNIFKHETSHAKQTWIGENNVCWLSNDDFLPSKLPNARIFIFEYNSNVAFNTIKSGINNTAGLLLNALFLERQVPSCIEFLGSIINPYFSRSIVLIDRWVLSVIVLVAWLSRE